MEKVKISVFLVVALVVFLVGSYVTLSKYYGGRLRSVLAQDVDTASEAVVRAKRLADLGQLRVAEEVCAWPHFAEKFQYEYEQGIEGKDKRHEFLWEELNVWGEKLKARGKAQTERGQVLEDVQVHVPDLMYVTDQSGEGVAKLTDYSWWGLDISKQYPIVLDVGKLDKPERDIWLVDGQIVEVSVCRVTNAQEQFQGAVIIGWILSDGDAEQLKKATGRDVVFFKNDRVLAGTLGSKAHHEVQREIVRAEKVHEAGTISSDQDYLVGEDSYVAAAGVFGGYYSKAVGGYMVLGNLGVAREPLAKTRFVLGIAGAALIIILIIGVLAIHNGFTQPLVEIDAGIHEIINGNFDYNFPTDEDTKETLAGGMAHSLNIMTCILQGKEIPEDEDDVTSAAGWGDDFTIDRPAAPKKKPKMAALPGLIPGLAPPAPKKELPPDDAEPAAADKPAVEAEASVADAPAEEKPVEAAEPAGEAESADLPEPPPREEPQQTLPEDRVSTAEHSALTAEPADSYYKRLFNEYVAARKENGEPTANITYEKFRDKLVRNEIGLRKKLGAKKVRFRVQTKAGKVSLKPIPLNE